MTDPLDEVKAVLGQQAVDLPTYRRLLAAVKLHCEQELARLHMAEPEYGWCAQTHVLTRLERAKHDA